jgi:hypothetical protein
MDDDICRFCVLDKNPRQVFARFSDRYGKEAVDQEISTLLDRGFIVKTQTLDLKWDGRKGLPSGAVDDPQKGEGEESGDAV